MARRPEIDDEGGLAGTVNLNIYHPLDYKDRVLSTTVRANYTDQAEKVNPSVTLIYADQFADNRLGVAVGFNYDYRNIVENRQGHGWTPLVNSMGKNAATLTADQLAIAQSTERQGQPSARRRSCQADGIAGSRQDW